MARAASAFRGASVINRAPGGKVRSRQPEGLYSGQSRTDAARGRAEGRGTTDAASQAKRMAKPEGQPEGLYSGQSRADDARGRAEKRGTTDAASQAKRTAKPEGQPEGLYSGQSRADDARGRAERRGTADAASQAKRKVNGAQRIGAARGRAELRIQDAEAARDLGITARQVREERAWQQERARVKISAAATAVADNAALPLLPGGEVLLAAKVEAAVMRADAGHQARVIRPILRDRMPAIHAAKLSAAFGRFEESLAALAS